MGKIKKKIQGTKAKSKKTDGQRVGEQTKGRADGLEQLADTIHLFVWAMARPSNKNNLLFKRVCSSNNFVTN